MSESAGNQPLADVVDEARRITGAALAEGLRLKVTGGVAVAINCPSAATEPLSRRYADIDLVARGRDRGDLIRLMTGLGYQPDEVFNTLNGSTRLFFWDPFNGRQVDVFLDKVDMCHRIELADRIASDRLTLEPADILLMKLQIYETNEKDLVDIVTLLLDLEFTDDDSGMNLPYLAGLASGDWGLWRTTTIVAGRADEHARELPCFAHADRVHAQVARYLQALEDVPKSRGWKFRARVGESKRWYELPEEVR